MGLTGLWVLQLGSQDSGLTELSPAQTLSTLKRVSVTPCAMLLHCPAIHVGRASAVYSLHAGL